jgi:Sulfotransferase family
MDWKRKINDLLGGTTGYELRRTRPREGDARRPAQALGELRPGDRLMEAPVFVMCTLRSGSTLLRVLLDSHSQIHAPHEIHLRYVSVHLDRKWSERSMREMGLDARALEYLLWDRLLHRELATSGKRQIVDKTPNNVFIADRLRECWPDARFIFLLRHPAAIARSRQAVLGEDGDPDENVDLIRRYCAAVERARQAYDGLTVRYEDLASDPHAETRRLREFLGVEPEPEMVDYGRFDHGRYRSGLGDWHEKIKGGQVRPPEPPPAETPEPLRRAAEAWGYLTRESEAPAEGLTRS